MRFRCVSIDSGTMAASVGDSVKSIRLPNDSWVLANDSCEKVTVWHKSLAADSAPVPSGMSHYDQMYRMAAKTYGGNTCKYLPLPSSPLSMYRPASTIEILE